MGRECALACALLFAWPVAGHAECTNPSYAKLKPPRYPPEALAERAAGKVLLAVTVGADGVPSHAVVQTSSGNPYLDAAALSAIEFWRFNPRLCDGQPVEAAVVVPFEFDPSDIEPAESIPAAKANPPEQAGDPVVSEVGREVAPDHSAMGFANVGEMLRYLRHDADVVQTGQTIRPNAAVALSFFVSPRSRQTYDVIESTERGWSAVNDAWTSIIRTRFISQRGTEWELYAQLCNGSTDWCASILKSYLATMRENPPPIPPPAPVGSEHAR